MFDNSVKFEESSYMEYFIDKESNVYSRSKVGKKVKKITKQLNNRGYERIRANNKNHLLHRTMAHIFLDKPSNYQDNFVVNHIDGIKNNNKLSNLEWLSPQENVEHSWNTGLSSGHFKRKLNAKQVREIRKSEGVIPRKDLATMYKVSRATINDVINKNHYKDIK